MSREVADPSQLTDEDLGLANVILTNGARLYVDHAHPEYSTPECTTPLDIVRWDKAGEQIALDACRFASVTGEGDLLLYKNNTDNKGASYGAHENYLVRRSTPFGDIVRHLTPFFVSRQVVCGAGRVGLGQDGHGDGFQISQRADYFEVEVGLETTLKRPIINTRDEPHADPEKYRRLHVILGDANLSEISTYLKVGTTALVLTMIEDRFLTADLSVSRPVASLKHVSHDPTPDPPPRGRRRPPDDRRGAAVGVLPPRRSATSTERRGGETDDAHPGRARPLGVGADPPRARPLRVRRRARLGGQAQAAELLPRPGRPGLVGRQAAPDRPAVRRPAPGEGALPPAGQAGPDEAARRATRSSRRRCTSRPRTPGPTSAAAA